MTGDAQTAAIKPGDNFVVDGIPPIPASVAERVGRYVEFRAALIKSWHSTRPELLIGTRFADTMQLHLVKFPGGDRRQLTFYKDSVGAATFNPNGGEYFLFSKDVGGSEFAQIYRFDLTTGDITLLTDGKSKNDMGVWSRNGGLYSYTSTRRNGTDADIYAVNPSNPRSDRLVAQVTGGGWGPLDWSPDGSRLLAQEYLSVTKSRLWVIDSASGTKKAVTPDEEVAYGDGKFSEDGKGVFVTTDKDSEFHRLAYIDLSTGQYSYLTNQIKWDITEFEITSDGKTIAFLANEEGVGTLHLMSSATRKEKVVPKLPAGSISGIVWHKNGRLLGFNLDSARSPFDVYSLDVKSGKVERWTQSETGGLVTNGFQEPELIHWKSFDGRTISGFLYKPPVKFSGKRPVVIDIHGGPEGQFQPVFLGRYNYYLNEMGVAHIFPNVRGSIGYGKTFVKLDNGFQREDSYKDIGALLDWIKTRPDLDADRIMVTGGSYGGHMTLAISYLYSNRIRCALDIVGMSNLVTFLEHTESYRRDLRRVEYGDERDPKMRAFLEQIAPLNNADKIKKPLFVVQGKNDPRVPYTEAEQIVNTLKKHDTPVWFLMANDEGHGFAKKKNADFLFYAKVLFMQEFLLK